MVWVLGKDWSTIKHDRLGIGQGSKVTGMGQRLRIGIGVLVKCHSLGVRVTGKGYGLQVRNLFTGVTC